jgi:hypothetical protein
MDDIDIYHYIDITEVDVIISIVDIDISTDITEVDVIISMDDRYIPLYLIYR